MTATINGPGVSGRQPLRLASMEILGFLDDPWNTATWTSAQPQFVAPVASANGATPAVDPITNWVPTEMGSRLYRGRIRWGVLTALIILASTLGLFAYWLYQRPAAMVAEAVSSVEEVAGQLQSELQTIAAATATLEAPDPRTPLPEMLALDAAARALFEASASLPASETTSRAAAVNAAGDALDVTSVMGDAFAYRAAVIPVLVAPDLETDPALIALDEAAQAFAVWQTQFDAVRAALPAGGLSSVTSQLDAVSSDLDSIRVKYLDSLREDDRWGAIVALRRLDERLSEAEGALFQALGAIRVRVDERITSALGAVEALLG